MKTHGVLFGLRESKLLSRPAAEAFAGSVKLFANVTTSSRAWSTVKNES
jgi:hypothetical protein